MTIEHFRAALHEQPYRPFILRMADGRAFEVRHPDFVAHSPSGRTAVVFHANESHSVLDLLLMTEIEVSATNGQPVQ
jgi:hypothetical protein